MEDNLLINYLKRNKDYCFYIGQYEFPKKLETINGNFIDLEYNRKKNLLQGSNWSPNFKAVLDSEFRGVKYHREFPLIVRNLKAWRHYSLNHNVTDPDKLDRNYFLADYFFPDHNLVVEIDSDMHDPWYDSARDDYMNVVYGLQVIRLYEFGEPSTEVARIGDKKTTSEKPCIPYICTSGARNSWSRRPSFKGSRGKEVIVLMNFDCFIVTAVYKQYTLVAR